MTSQAYILGMGSIKDQLSRYSHLSVLNCALSHLGVRKESDLEEGLMMPWVVMLLLKVSMLGVSGAKDMSEREFIRIANEIFHLQGAAADLSEENIELKVRAMILGQMFYQRKSLSGLRDLTVQGTVFSRADGYYDNLFLEVFGLSLDSYLKIAMFIVVRLDAQTNSGVLRVPLSELLLYLCPGIPYEHVLAFVRLASCDARDLPGFVAGHDLGGIFASEYYQETPFKYIPFILDGAGLVAFNYKFCITAICGLAPAILKKEYPAFKDEFGSDMEARVGELLESLPHDQLLDESELQKLLSSKGIDSKLVDYLVREGDQVTLVECKAIEPTDLVKCTADAKVLKRSLEKSYIYAIHQGQAVANALSGLEEYKGCSFRQLVVTYGDHFVFGGKYIAENIDLDLVGSVTNNYGRLPIPMERISYLSLQDLAGLIYGLKEKGRLLGEFLDTACDVQSDPQRRRFTLAHVVEDEIGGVPGTFAAGLGGEMDRKQVALETLIRENPKYWSGKAEHFMERHASLINALNPSYLDIKGG